MDEIDKAKQENSAYKALIGDDDVMEAGLWAHRHGNALRQRGMSEEDGVRMALMDRGFSKEMADEGVGAFHHAKESMDSHSFYMGLATHSFGTSSGWTPKYKKNADGEYLDASGNVLADQGDTSQRVLATGSGGAGLGLAEQT